MPLPTPPRDARALLDFPRRVFKANQPLARIHRELHETAYFSTDPHGRFNPSPEKAADFGTCCLSTLPMGAFLEVFSRIQPITRQHIDERVLAHVYLPSDVVLADVTHPAVLGRWSLTAEINTTANYSVSQAWASSWEAAGFGGVFYAAKHDPRLVSRSIALFGKPGVQEDSLIARTEAIPPWLVREAKERFGFRILPSSRLN